MRYAIHYLQGKKQITLREVVIRSDLLNLPSRARRENSYIYLAFLLKPCDTPFHTTMPEQHGAPEARLHPPLLPTDLAALAINVFFATTCFLNAGKLPWRILGMTLDRGAAMGCVFLSFITLQFILIRFLGPMKAWVPRFFRFFYPQAFLFSWFGESIILSQMVAGGTSHDAAIAALDRLIFGFDPAIVFHKALNGPLWTEIFFSGYFSYYPLIILGWWILFFRKKDGEAIRSLFIVTASFGLLLAWYVFFPVQGPKYFFPELHSSWYSNFKGYFFTWFMKGAFSGMNLAGAAFPSSHVAIATVAIILNAKHNRFILPVFVPLTLLLFASTVFLYAHYAVDVLAGVAAGLLLYAVMSSVYGRIERMTGRIGKAMVRSGLLPQGAINGRSK